MKISARHLGALVASLMLACASVGVSAQDTSARQAAMQQIAQRAEALSEDQIKASHNVAALGTLKQVYQRMGDKQRYRWTLQQLSRLVPGSLSMKMELAASYAADDMKTEAYNLLLHMKKQGFGLDISDMPAFKNIHGTEVWDYIVKGLKANMQTFGKGEKAFDLPARDLLYNALAWDPVHDKFLVGSARDGGIYHADAGGKLSPFIQANDNNKLWSIMDMAVDAKRGRLWVASTSVVYFKGYDADNAGKAALLSFDLESGKMLHRYPLDGTGKFLSAVAVAPDGTVYAADGINRVIYTVKDGKLGQFVNNPRLSNIRTLAVSSDGANLYLADTALGIIGIDLSSGKPFALQRNPQALVLPGIVDMHSYKDTLIVIEPGMQPQRVLRLKLSDDGRKVLSAMPLDVANPLFELLGNGVTVGSKLYFLTSNQREAYDSYGLLKSDAKLEPAHVFVSDMEFAWGKGGIDIGLPKTDPVTPAQRKAMLEAPSSFKQQSQADKPAAGKQAGDKLD